MGLFFLCVGGEKKNLCHQCCVNLCQAGVSFSWARVGTGRSWQVLAGLRGCFGCSVTPAALHIHPIPVGHTAMT